MKKTLKITIILMSILLLSGCTKYLSDEKKANITYEKTGQIVTSNILCKPTDKELIKIYEANESKLSTKLADLPNCKEFVPSNIKYVGIWESIFVKPLAWIIIQVGNLVSNYGLSVMLIGLLIRICLMPLSKKSLVQSKKMKELQPELKNLEKKYKDKNDKESMMQKSQETMLLYKKYGISPLSGCLVSLLQLPLFFAFLEAINRIPAIFEGSFLSLQLGTTPLTGISKGNYAYIIFLILIIMSTYLSLKDTMNSTPSIGSDDSQAKQSKNMVMFMLVFISLASFSLPTAVGLYWIVTNLFSAIQSIIIKKEK